MPSPILVTQPSLPPLDEFIESLHDIWDRKWLTNNGVYHQQFEKALAEYLGVKHVSLFCNGMIALQVGLQALEVTGEVITTPFSFPATTHAIHWNHCTPVFCDIEPDTCNLDPAKIEALITPQTTCILPVHVYGNPCDVDAIQAVADKHGLKVFYDAAHAFGVGTRATEQQNSRTAACLGGVRQDEDGRSESGDLISLEPAGLRRITVEPTVSNSTTDPAAFAATPGQAKHKAQSTHSDEVRDKVVDSTSILNFGDLSMLSFHATKVFNTIEGGH